MTDQLIPGLAVRLLDVTDLPECLRLAEDREWAPEERKWRLLFEVGDVYGIDDPDGGLAGTVVSTRFGREVAAIGMMLVAKRHERRGLGSALMRYALDRSGTASAWLTATAYGRPMYERLGFRGIGQCATHVGQVTGLSRGTSRPAEPSDLPAILALDAEVFGAPRVELLTRLQSFSERFRVVDGPSGLAGFGGAWRNMTETVLGPMIAQDADVALELLSDLASEVEGPVRVDIDTSRPELLAWAERHGLTHSFSTTIMEYGEALPGDRTRLFTPVMVALG
ncbi:GNAT family N-acetyltransferase [Microtetraspora sp. NBRC 16547]|uniref:GNAT family N-acetyltransferase n=1 Tax=Microtetraspora sp. NBRC 16547 TaxID=3030993 RepID=UPI0024A28161|nr:GNAT family N-acetyltransferase [Microtetraspora sp. NBRC 16547]GLX01344.1 acetyltransferase [Microtetraspora sp. NBRC 16547]